MKYIEAFMIRGINETRNGQTVSNLPAEVTREANKRLAEIDDKNAQISVVPVGHNAMVIVVSDITDAEYKKRTESDDEGRERVGQTISVHEANKRAKEEKEKVDGAEMQKAEKEFQDSLKNGNEDDEVEETDEQGNKRRVKKSHRHK